MSRKNQPTGMTYRIAHVRDFLNVPPKRLAACLRDFRTWVRCQHAGAEFVAQIAPEAKVTPADFVWTDDGIAGASHMVIRGEDGEVMYDSGKQNFSSGLSTTGGA